ncbi:tripartite tricarboxylate transporter permease [Pacificibacter marinus]|uniref:tripartite tricarboxylate transporter permease n=1 Tax=Pacificibacter marinus TaxID=658057 RepID=UPI001C07EBAF|nr:tripartite tricarboxylate transporter permease [Pacificibacter marinus]MBU2865642.1 tripartite tricarboxylate transporter permease [Pacificibacter marinus]
MGLWDSYLASFPLLLQLETFAWIATGLFLGVFVGAMPGLTTTMAMAILLPIAFFSEPLIGVPFLMGVYKGGIFGGSIPAILVSIPGTGAAAATVFDGPALTRKGQSRKALDIALVASVIGDTSSDIITIIAIGVFAMIAAQIGPPELAAVILLSLIVIAATSNGLFVKAMVMLVLGLFLGMIGQDPIGALSRFTFDVFELRSGIPLLPMLIGLFALPEVMIAAEKRASDYVKSSLNLGKEARLTWVEFRSCLRTIIRSTGIGTMIGAIPGTGQVAAAFIGYAAAKNASKEPEKFGTGHLEGVAAPEAANNAVNGPTLVPLLTLGIPGDNITAILLGAFIAQGIRPGPDLMIEQGPMVYAILNAMIIANLMLLVIGYFTIPLFARVVTIRKSLLLPLTVTLAFAGAYVFRYEPTDLYFLVGFGLFGYACRKLHFPVTPMIMAFIIGQDLERAVGQSISIAHGDIWGFILFERPVALCLLLATPLLAWWMWRRTVSMQRLASKMLTEEKTRSSPNA